MAKIKGFCELYSSDRLLAFTMIETDIPDNVQSKLYWGREKSTDYCWAGFKSEITYDSGNLDHY
jgi:hypothetical protein